MVSTERIETMKITFESDTGHTVVWEIPGDDDENLK